MVPRTGQSTRSRSTFQSSQVIHTMKRAVSDTARKSTFMTKAYQVCPPFARLRQS